MDMQTVLAFTSTAVISNGYTCLQQMCCNGCLCIHAAYPRLIGLMLHVTSRAVTLLLLCLAVHLSEKQLVPVWLLLTMQRLLQATVIVTQQHVELSRMQKAQLGKIADSSLQSNAEKLSQQRHDFRVETRHPCIT